MTLKNQPEELRQAARWALAIMTRAERPNNGKERKKGKKRSNWAFLSFQSQLRLTWGSSIYYDKLSLDKICQVQLHCIALGTHVFTTDCKQRHMKRESQHWALLDLPGFLPEHICMKCLSLEDLDSHGGWTAPLSHLCLLEAIGQHQLPSHQMDSSFQELHTQRRAQRLLRLISLLQQWHSIKLFKSPEQPLLWFFLCPLQSGLQQLEKGTRGGFFGWGFASLEVYFPPYLASKTRAWKDPGKFNILQSLEDAWKYRNTLANWAAVGIAKKS